MSDRDFEQQVNQKLEELKLRPSDTVWMEVEKNIRQDNRRRRFLWLWLPMLFICLTTSAYILYRYTLNTENTSIAQAVPASSSSNVPASEITNTTKQTTTTNITPESANEQTGKNTRIHSLQPTDGKQPDVSTPAAAHETSPVPALANTKQPAIGVTEKNSTEKTIGINNKKPVRSRVTADDYSPPMEIVMPDKHAYRVSGKKKILQGITVQKEVAVQQEPVTTTITTGAEPIEQDDALTVAMPVMVNDIDNGIATNKAATVPFNSKSVHLMMPDSATTATAAVVPIQRKRPVLWHWGIVTDAGFTSVAESKLLQLRGLLGQDKTMSDPAASNIYGGSNSFLNVSTTTTTKKASPIQPDLSFSAGVFVQRALSRRFKLSLGLEYSYMSVNTQIGHKIIAPTVINTGSSSAKIVPEYYKSPGYGSASADASLQGSAANYQATYFSQKYRYRFQYIEIPLMANWQINKGRRLPPVAFEGGVSISHLLSVHALNYEGVKGIYYEDNTQFNKTQFNFVAGLNVGLLQKSKHPIWVGPNLRYALNGLVKKDISTKQYLWSTGISVKILLGKL